MSNEDFDPKRTVKSLAKMLGWENIPPRQVLEASMHAVEHRLASTLADNDLLQARVEWFESLLCALAFDHAAVVREGFCWASRVPIAYSACIFCNAARPTWPERYHSGGWPDAKGKTR